MKIKIQKIKKNELIYKTSNMVCDLSIKDDNSYTVGESNIIVHNCLTSENAGIGYPLASLMKECYEVSQSINNPAKIVADGGIKSYSDILKALALGADYVQIGSLFNKALESCGDTYFKGIKINMTNFILDISRNLLLFSRHVHNLRSIELEVSF